MAKFKSIVLWNNVDIPEYKNGREKLRKAIEEDGYEICGVVPLLSTPEMIAESLNSSYGSTFTKKTEVFLVNKSS